MIRRLAWPLLLLSLVATACGDGAIDPNACGDQDEQTLVTVSVDVDGDDRLDGIRLTRGVIATCTGSGDDVFEHPDATEHLVPWSFGPEAPMGLLFGSSTVELLELTLTTWTPDGWELVSDQAGEPILLRAGRERSEGVITFLHDHQCGSEPTQIVSTTVDVTEPIPMVTTTTWQISGTTATASVESNIDPTLNPNTWFERRPTVPCPWMEG
ncbi:MAG: hypothetical protein R3249_10125 [Nitriliruptorales bacterium]|nr:hypothetical protein [Nitriliruptorales bacterium]